jgi:hypothetical protein
MHQTGNLLYQNRVKGQQELGKEFQLFIWNHKLLNTLTTFSQQVEITLLKCSRVWQQVFERWTHCCLADI